MRILHCIPSIWHGSGGPTRAVVDMTCAVTATDPRVRVDIATTDFGLTAEWKAQVQQRLPASTQLLVFPETPWLGPEGASASLWRWLWRNLRAYDVMHVHALFHGTSSVAAFIARRLKVPYVLRPLGTLSPYTFTHRRALAKRIYFAMIDRRTLDGAAIVHFTAPQEQLKAARLALRSRGVVIPVPVAARSRAASRAARYEEDSADELRVLFMSRLHPVKGLDLLIPAFARARRAHSQARLLIAGNGSLDYTTRLHALAEQWGVSEHVEWLGWVDGEQQVELMSTTHIFAQPSYQENFGVSIVEALAFGLPVLITREVDIWPDIERFGSGVVCETTIDSVAAGLERLLGDAELRRRCADAGPRQVAELYAASVVGEGLVEMYGMASRSSVDGRRP